MSEQPSLKLSMPWQTAVKLYAEVLQRGSAEAREKATAELVRLADKFYEQRDQIAQLYDELADMKRDIIQRDEADLERQADEATRKAQQELLGPGVDRREVSELADHLERCAMLQENNEVAPEAAHRAYAYSAQKLRDLLSDDPGNKMF